MLGWRWVGSSLGRGLCIRSDFEPVSSMTFSASSLMVNSLGLPVLTGPVKSSGVSMSRTKASIRSST